MKRNILICAYILLGIYIIFQVLNFSHLEFKTKTLDDIVSNLSFLCLLLLLTVIAICLPSNHNGIISRFIIIMVSLVVIAIWVMGVTIFSGFPEVPRFEKILYINKANENHKIIEQFYESGITGANFNYDTIETRNITENIRWTKQINITTIDLNSWIEVTDDGKH